MNNAEIEQTVRAIAEQAREASLHLATVATETKNQALEKLAELLVASEETLLQENRKDLSAGEENGLSTALLDRLKITRDRLAGIADGVRQIAALPDPVGEEMEKIRRPNGIEITKVRVPIGVIGIIYESRPNVTIDCAALCLKAGNASILRGGKEAFHTNSAFAAILRQALEAASLPAHSAQLIPTVDRHALACMLKLDTLIQCIIPRGGESLIRFVAENSLIPVIKHYKGVCGVFVDKDADPAMAEKIVLNAKCQRPGVCNAAEQLLIHQDIAGTFLPRVARSLARESVELRVDPAAAEILQRLDDPIAFKEASEQDWSEEYLDLILAVKIVPSAEAAVAHINHHGSGHSDAIVTSEERTAKVFLNGVDSASVYWNASTRFTDGFEFGMGAEIGISTDKLHARGPMGLKELCSYKYLVTGSGQVK